MFTGTQDRYRPIARQQGTLADAITDLESAIPTIVHVHWEEFVLDGCASEAAADVAALAFVADIERFHALGGTLVWTVHNELPHEIDFHRQFISLRAVLARRADLVLVQHAVSAAGLAEQPARRLQGFGWIRHQKRYGEMLDMLPPSFLAARDLTIRISGRGPEAEAVMAPHTHRRDVVWDVRHVPGAEAPHLLRSATCVLLPYRRSLTSGVALLAISVGALIVAVDNPQMRELLPPPSHRFLYAHDDASALRGVIDDVLGLSGPQRRKVIDSHIERALALHQRAISSRLADLYDEALAEASAAPGRAV